MLKYKAEILEYIKFSNFVHTYVYLKYLLYLRIYFIFTYQLWFLQKNKTKNIQNKDKIKRNQK